jgi:hypothetical protein
MSAVLQAERQTALGETSSSEGQQQRRWKNPNEVVRIRRKLSRKPSLKYIPGQRSESLREDTTKRTTPVLKRTTLKRTSENLTASTPPKRPRGGLQDISNSPVAPPRTPDKKNLAPQDPHKDRDCITTEYPPPTLSSPSDTVAALPLDWALKTKVRFVSPFPFTWTQSLRPQQEASGLTNFLTGSGDQIHHKASCDRQEELQERLMLWVHPSLPFLKVFPRNSSASDTRQKIPHYTALLQDEQVLQALRDDWSDHLAPNLFISPHISLLTFTLSFYITPTLVFPSISLLTFVLFTPAFKKLTRNFDERSKFVLRYNVRSKCWS